jgi:hypothetical protein
MIYFALFLILFEATPEGLADAGHKRIAGLLEFIYRAVVTVIIFMWICGVVIPVQSDKLGYGLLGYLFLRFAIFDYIYNLSAGQYLNFIGTTKIWDRVLGRILKVGKVQFNLLHFLRFIFLVIGITFLLKK